MDPSRAARARTQRLVEAEVARRTDELVATTQRIAHLNRVASMTQLAASIAHELNQPLAAILSNAQAARRLLERGTPDVAEALAALGDIVEDDRRAGQIIQRMRAMLKKGETRADVLDLNELAREVWHLVAHDAQLRGATLRLALGADLPCVQGDGIQLQQVVLNLVVNALDAVSARPAGQRRVEVRTGREAEVRVALSVEDSGTGIAPPDLERIFDSFFTTKAHGLGVGLSISRSIVEAHGGRLWAENNPGGGATFHCVLPAWEEEKPAAAREPEPRASFHDTGSLLGTSKRVAIVPRAGDAPIPTSTTTREARGPRVARPALPAGTMIKHYELIRLLGEGGMGSVYLARDTKLGRLCAIKQLLSADGDSAERLLAEARATARCKHENIVVIYEVDEHEGAPYLVLEYIEGRTLRSWLEERRHPEGPAIEASPATCVELLLPVARALVCAHDLGIVHRDLKPENILLGEDGSVKVVDFGIAKWVAPYPGGASEDPDEGMAGTLPYMAPEQWLGEAIDPRVDLWAFGIILHEMALGAHPLAPVSWTRLSEVAALDTPMPKARAARPDLGPLGALIDRCLEKHKEARIASAKELCTELVALRAGGDLPSRLASVSPFAGLLAFQESDEARFFGRDRDIAGALSRLHFHPLVAVAAPSGAGKSSFVRAGLIPAYKRAGAGREAFVLRPGRAPLLALAYVLGDVAAEALPSMLVSSPEAGLGPEGLAKALRTRPGLVGALLRAHCRARGPGSGALVFVDQFEELWTLCGDAEERAAFLACLEGAADDASSPLRVVLAMRSDFLDRIADDRKLAADIGRGLFLLAPLGREALREALTRPVEALGYRFESEALIERMLGVLAKTRSPLPLLQFTAAKLWEARDAEKCLLTEASYEALGGVEGTLATHADAVLGAMPARDMELARAFFERLVTPERTRAIVDVGELRELAADPKDAERVLGRLVEARLLVVEPLAGEGGGTVEIVHESLIERWPRLSRWLDDSEEDVAFVARLRSAARQWRQGGEPEGLLWRDEAVLEAKRWRERSRAELAAVEKDFLAAVFALAERKARARRLSILALVAASLLCAVVMGYLALRELRASEAAQANAEEARQQAARAHQQAERARDAARLASARDKNGDPTLALALLREVSGPEELPAWTGLAMRAVRAPISEAVLGGHDGMVYTAEFSPDGSRIVTCSAEVAHVWDIEKGSDPVVLRHTGPVWRATHSPDGRHILTASWDGTARIWNADGTGAPLVLAHPGRVSWASWSPDGKRVATGGWYGARIWNADGRGEPRVLQGHTQRVRRVFWSPDSGRVVTASFDGTARVWSADGEGEPVVLSGHTDTVYTAVFSPDGARVATASGDGTARIWSADGKGEPRVLRGHGRRVNDVAWSPDGRFLASASLDNTARVWRADGEGEPVVLTHADEVRTVTWSPDGTQLLTSSVDKTARLWRLGALDTTTALVGHGAGLEWAVFSPDGARVVTGGGEGAARVWSARQRSAPVVFSGPAGVYPVLGYSPDGKRVLQVWPGETAARIWNADGSGEPLRLEGPKEALVHGGLGAGGRLVVLTYKDGATRIWRSDGSGEPVVLRAPGGPAELSALSPDGARVAVAHADGSLRVFRADGSGEPLVLRAGGLPISQMLFTPDGTRLVSIALDDTAARVWNAEAGGAPIVLEGHTNIVHAFEMSPDGKRLVTASADNTARVWNVDGMGEPLVLRGHPHEVLEAAWSPDGGRIVTTSYDDTLRVWSADGKGEPIVLRDEEDVRHVAWSPDGRRLLSATERTLRVWNADGTGVPLILAGHTGLIHRAVFSPDGAQVASTALDGTIRIWPNVSEVPTRARLQEQLWEASGYCMAAELRRELLGVSEETAREELAACRGRVEGR
ncbi:protein kinase domain-containing protein [Polyangium aurulentum]|uniref:nSTAND1 domain-containing NTPase n=1 Tax=Polyangium aurulentum TaxID=2567896 RepID=UPI0010ADDE4A|nr:protein kinase [Polyangium aurulentum]UQA55543.1 protein kinase [Polyangium aurulentum]